MRARVYFATDYGHGLLMHAMFLFNDHISFCEKHYGHYRLTDGANQFLVSTIDSLEILSTRLFAHDM